MTKKSQTRIVNIPMTFDYKIFATDIIREVDAIKRDTDIDTDIEASVLLLGMSESYVSFLRQMSKGDSSCQKTKQNCMSMKTILHLSNTLGLDPRCYMLLDCD